MDAEEFLKSKTVTCARLHMRLTPESCRQIRERKGLSQFDNEGGPPPQCIDCPGVSSHESDDQKEDIMPTATQQYTIKEIGHMAGITSGGSLAYALKQLCRHRENLPENSLKVKAVLDSLGITAKELLALRTKKGMVGSKGKTKTASPTKFPAPPDEEENIVSTPEPAPVIADPPQSPLLPKAGSAHGVKYDSGKLRLDLIPPEVTRALGEVMTYGADKYADRNWEKGISSERIYAALQRHLLAWREGGTVDQESGLPHLAHALANAGMLVTLEQRRALS